MNKSRKAKLLKVEQKEMLVAGEPFTSGRCLMWVATDTTGRSFQDTTRVGAVEMLEHYNRAKSPP